MLSEEPLFLDEVLAAANFTPPAWNALFPIVRKKCQAALIKLSSLNVMSG